MCRFHSAKDGLAILRRARPRAAWPCISALCGQPFLRGKIIVAHISIFRRAFCCASVRSAYQLHCALCCASVRLAQVQCCIWRPVGWHDGRAACGGIDDRLGTVIERRMLRLSAGSVLGLRQLRRDGQVKKAALRQLQRNCQPAHRPHRMFAHLIFAAVGLPSFFTDMFASPRFGFR